MKELLNYSIIARGDYMLLCIDVGNTNIKLALYENDKIILKLRVATDSKKTEDEFAAELHGVLKINDMSTAKIDGAIISSVVPKVTRPLCEAVRKLTGVNTIVVGPGVKSGLDLRIDNPASLGADLLCMCVAAKELYSCPAVIIGLGTATTIVYLNKNKRYCGGAITAGVNISLDALTNHGALLPSVDLNPPKKSICTNTEECIKSGIIFGTACMLDGMIERYIDETGEVLTIVATGGLAPSIVKNCKHDIIINDDLVLEGLKIIYNKNNK